MSKQTNKISEYYNQQELKKYGTILEKDLTDKNIEFFWYNFKEFYGKYMNDVDVHSRSFNIHQKNENYDIIISTIGELVKLTVWKVLMDIRSGGHVFNIMETNIHRWEHALQDHYNNNDEHDEHDEHDHIFVCDAHYILKSMGNQKFRTIRIN